MHALTRIGTRATDADAHASPRTAPVHAATHAPGPRSRCNLGNSNPMKVKSLNIKSVLRLAVLVLALAAVMPAKAQSIRKSQYSTPLYYVDGQKLREHNKYGSVLFYRDDSYVRSEGRYGDRLLYLDGNTVRSGGPYGDRLLYKDGNNIRVKDKYGDVLAYIDGNKLRARNRYGDVLLYFDGVPSWWVVATLMIY